MSGALGCGRCIRACPEGALSAGEQAYRVVVGGKLGRRPVLARELNGVYTLKQAEALLGKVLEWHGHAFDNGLRVRDVMDLDESIFLNFSHHRARTVFLVMIVSLHAVFLGTARI